jgi:hypothetical protein
MTRGRSATTRARAGRRADFFTGEWGVAVVSRLPVALIAALSLLIGGCNFGGEFPTAPTRGRVVCEGQPVPHVMVFFEPVETGKSALVGKSGFAIAKEDGTFVISTYGTGDGAVVGHHRVRVGLPHREDFPNFKCECYLNSEVDLTEVDVKKGQNEFELVLKKKTGREPPPRKDD